MAPMSTTRDETPTDHVDDLFDNAADHIDTLITGMPPGEAIELLQRIANHAQSMSETIR